MSTTNARIQFKRDTTDNWNHAQGMIPLEGEVIVYNDYSQVTKVIDGVQKIVNIPAIKIGDGRAYVQDLPFVNEDLRIRIMEHIENPAIHVTAAEKLFWNNKINVNDLSEVVSHNLIFNRN